MIIDTPGLADPQKHQIEIWTRFVNDMHGQSRGINLESDGIACIIFPIMANVHGRVEEDSIKAMIQALSLLTVLNPEFDLDDYQGPKFIIVVNNFSRSKGINKS